MTVAFTKPFNQKIRIASLRLGFAALLPVLAVAGSGWNPAMVDMMEVGGILCIICAVIGRFWAILYIGGRKNATVMADGPYSICRHPLYLFSTVGAVGFGLMLGSLVVTAVVGGLAFAVLSMTATREERYLRHAFAGYDAYARRVPRLLPSLRLFRTPSRVTFDTGTLLRNSADALVFVGLIPLAEMLNWLHAAQVIPTLRLF